MALQIALNRFIARSLASRAGLPNFVLSNVFILRRNCASEKKKEEFLEKTEVSPLSNITTKNFEEKSFDTEAEHTQETNDANSIRSIKYTLIFLGITITCIGTYIILEFGKPEVDAEGNKVTDEFSKMPLWQQYLYRSYKQIQDFTLIIREPSRDKLLPDELKYPFYQPPYTLILEFTDVMVHPEWTYKTGWRFKKRPGLDYMLESLVGLFEIVVYTAEQGMTVFPILDSLDPRNLITYKLVRDATHFVDGHHVKNLDKLNRDLNKVIVIDWNSESVKFHPDNLFLIKKWEGNDEDQTLVDLTAFLKTVATSEVEDVREVLKYYSQFEDPVATFRQKQREYYDMQEQQSKDKQQKRTFSTLFS